MKSLGKVYVDNGGDLNRISRYLRVKFKENASVVNPEDFAVQFLNGTLVVGPLEPVKLPKN